MNEEKTLSNEDIRLIGEIPVRNLWLLILYASEFFEDAVKWLRESKKEKLSAEDNPDDIPDLVAEILCRRVEERIRRNLSYGYQRREAVLSRVRGHIDMLRTECHRLTEKGKVACRFDELTVDTPRNRYVRSALERLSSVIGTNLSSVRQSEKNDRKIALARRCGDLATTLTRMGVVGSCPTEREISLERFGRHDLQDRAMLIAARLAFDLALPTEQSGERTLSSPDRNDKDWIYKIYEKGIAGFYKFTLSSEWNVEAGKALKWNISEKKGKIRLPRENVEMPDKAHCLNFPSMKSDIILTKDNHRIIIDTKFTSIQAKSQHEERMVLQNSHIYQIYAYLKSKEAEEKNDKASGILLYPAIDCSFNECVVIDGHELRFATVDLAASSEDIKERLLEIIGAEAQ